MTTSTRTRTITIWRKNVFESQFLLRSVINVSFVNTISDSAFLSFSNPAGNPKAIYWASELLLSLLHVGILLLPFTFIHHFVVTCGEERGLANQEVDLSQESGWCAEDSAIL